MVLSTKQTNPSTLPDLPVSCLLSAVPLRSLRVCLQQLRQLLLDCRGSLGTRHGFGDAIVGLIAAAMEHERIATAVVFFVPLDAEDPSANEKQRQHVAGILGGRV